MQTKLESTRAYLAEDFRNRIFVNEFTPGTPLREQTFARNYGVSRGPIRDVFLQLTREGLLEARPNAGVRVSEAPSPFKRRLLVQLRRRIETEALAKWFECGENLLLEQLRDNLTVFAKACRKENLREVVALDMAFHRAIVAAPDKASLLPVWTPIISQIFLRYSRHTSLSESCHEHRGILEAMEAHDPKTARERLARHIV